MIFQALRKCELNHNINLRGMGTNHFIGVTLIQRRILIGRL